MDGKRKQIAQISGFSAVKAKWLARQYFSADFLDHLSQQIATDEQQHAAQLVVAIESSQPPQPLSARDRALEVFGRLMVWDTPDNTGVLLYINLAMQCIEIVADRGIQVEQERWQQVCYALSDDFKQKRYTQGVQGAVGRIAEILQQACPLAVGQMVNNILPDRPVML